jgi:hypothetical protein
MDEKTANFELLEPSQPDSLIPDSPIEPWMTVVAALVVLAMLVYLKFRKTPATALDPTALRNAAYAEAIAKLGSISGVIPARETAVLCSMTLRKYLSTAAGDPALFETHEETISRHDLLTALSTEARSAAVEGFSRLASLKYSKNPPAAEPLAIVADASTLLKTLHHGFSA